MFLIPLKIQTREVPHWKALRCSISESRGLCCSCIRNIYHHVLKNDNLHKQEFVESQMVTTLTAMKKYCFITEDHILGSLSIILHFWLATKFFLFGKRIMNSI